MTAADLQASRGKVDYLVIALPELRDAAQALADDRQTKGLSSRVVVTDEIYDVQLGRRQPGYPTQSFCVGSCRMGPRYVVLAGRAARLPRLKEAGVHRRPRPDDVHSLGLFGCDTALSTSTATARRMSRSVASLRHPQESWRLPGQVEPTKRGQFRWTLPARCCWPTSRTRRRSFPRDSDWVADLLPEGMP